MKQKYIFHLKIYIFFQSCQCCQCREPINDLVSGVVLKRKLDDDDDGEDRQEEREEGGQQATAAGAQVFSVSVDVEIILHRNVELLEVSDDWRLISEGYCHPPLTRCQLTSSNSQLRMEGSLMLS